MKHLIICANPNPNSFTQAIKNQIENTLTDINQPFITRNLYDMNFKSVLDMEDFNLFFQGKIPNDIAFEQSEITKADIIHFVFPLWWAGLPAIFKGYIDRVFTPGFAYKRDINNNLVAMLNGRKSFLWTSHGNTEQEYNTIGMYESLTKTIDGILEYVGIEVIEHTYFPDIRKSDLELRQKWLNDVKELIVQNHNLQLVNL